MSNYYNSYKVIQATHYQQKHVQRKAFYLRDPSCVECNPLDFEPSENFKNFWHWYQTITQQTHIIKTL